MSQAKIYVGNLSFQSTEDDLREHFGSFGDIAELKLIMDRDTGRSKGFAFITYSDKSAAQAALQANDTVFGGRTIRVNEAKERDSRDGGGHRGGHRGGGGYR